MEIEIQFTREAIAGKISPPAPGDQGARLEFRGVVRDKENGGAIVALEYEAYPEMAEREIRRLLQEISARHHCLSAKVIHRIGVIPVGDTAIYVGIASAHRGEAIALLAEFMDRLKQDVPIWKRRALPVGSSVFRRPEPAKAGTPNKDALLSLDEAFDEIRSRCRPLPAVRVSLAEAFGRVLRETVCAPEDLPDCDRSTRDGYAILQNDVSETFQVVDTLHAADWRPRELKTGQAVRIATGAPLPCDNLRIIMQEHVERTGDKMRIMKHENSLNLRKRGEDVRAGQPLVHTGARLDAGKLALLASAGCAQPLVSPRLRVVHFTTGDEIVPPDQTPKRGQVRDSNSILIRGLLQHFPCDMVQTHLPEDFERAKTESRKQKAEIENANVILVSGGASVGDKDFTRPLLEWLGFEIVFSQVNVRPGRPLIFARNGKSVAFGLPGNPLSHFVCFHLFVATALARLVGAEPPAFQRGQLAAKLDDEPNPRETLWPAKWHGRAAREIQATGGSGNSEQAGETPAPLLMPLKWSSSGDITCLAETNALIRVPANRGLIESGAEVDFLPTEAFGLWPNQSSHRLDATSSSV